ncbi:uncharacterized protein NPIL_518051 [Nephila pilipes]|uniref:Uncharacterized protein n=1 Tax=Nephila pilipes TaxID=299642 RepID=A0A8X6TXL4_NEPPI|nr:uncharacterized protein NPIL_518051 [Nephila pilipes]
MKIKNDSAHQVNSYRITLSYENNIYQALKRFWEIEDIPSLTPRLSEEEFCEAHFQKTYRVDENGRFIVKLPIFDEEKKKLGNSKPLAISRFLAMERKFAKNKHFEEQYKEFMFEYRDHKHLTLVKGDDNLISNGGIYYLPHHAFVKPSSTSTKLRVVFDGSCKAAKTVSLISILGVGPSIQRDIFSTLIYFRLHKIAFSADIVKMYRQILVASEDQNFQRIVWRDPHKYSCWQSLK